MSGRYYNGCLCWAVLLVSLPDPSVKVGFGSGYAELNASACHLPTSLALATAKK